MDVRNWIQRATKLHGRFLIGIDCNFAYSQYIGRQQFGDDYNYLDLWRAVEELSTDLPDYFAAGFWEHHLHAKYFWINGRKPVGLDDKYQRLTERVCRTKGYGSPENPFKLIGPKQVGKGGLAGMRLLFDLKRSLGDRVCIWPFENHIEEAKLVIAEIYPRLFLKSSGYGPGKIRKISDLNRSLAFFDSLPVSDTFVMTDHMSDAIISSAALRFLEGNGSGIPHEIFNPADMTEMISSREGWILGV